MLSFALQGGEDKKNEMIRNEHLASRAFEKAK